MVNAVRAVLLVGLAAAASGQRRQAAFVTTHEGGVSVFGERGELIRTIKLDVPLNASLSVDRSVTYGVGVQGECHGEAAGSLQQIDLRDGTLKPVPLTKLSSYQTEPGTFEVYESPAVSPSGRQVAFIVRPCDAEHRLDAVEGAGFVVVWDRQTAKARVLRGSLDVVGRPRGFAMNPTWSDDERYLLVNFEAGFTVLRASDGSVVGGGLLPDDRGLWSNAIGWIGSRCVVYMRGGGRPRRGDEPKNGGQCAQAPSGYVGERCG